MKTNNYIYIILLGFMASSCAPKHYFFSSKTNDFKCYKEEQKVSSNKLKKWQEGLYLFVLKVENKEIDGISFKWYSSGEAKDIETANSTTPRIQDRAIVQEVKKEHAYLLFLDDARVYYYSSYRKDKVKAPKKISDAYCCVTSACNDDADPRTFQPSETVRYDHIDRDIVLNQKYDLYKMRGYYEVYGDNYVKVELERPQKNRKAKKGKTEIIRLDFRLSNDTLIMQPLELERTRARGIKSIDNKQRINPEEELAIVPKFLFTKFGSTEEDRIKLSFRTTENEELQIKQISRDLEQQTIKYSLGNGCEIIEDLSNKKKVFTW